jgi:hypothetical protein
MASEKSMFEMRELTLETGEKITCRVRDFELLQDAIKKEDPKAIAHCTASLCMNSPEMMDKLVQGLTQAIEARKE